MQGYDINSLSPRARRLALAATMALALASMAPAAFAERGGGKSHGMHGGGSFAEIVPRLLEQAKASLNLDTSQQVMWDNAVAQGKAAREQGRANRSQVKEAVKAELARPDPDLAALAALADSIHDQNSQLRKQVRAQWLGLYATFTPEQKVVVRDLLAQRMARAESFRERMHERRQKAPRPAS